MQQLTTTDTQVYHEHDDEFGDNSPDHPSHWAARTEAAAHPNPIPVPGRDHHDDVLGN